MRLSVLISATLASGWLVACSNPAPEAAQSTRAVRLPAPAATETPLVSTLEAGQTLKAAHVHHSAQRTSLAAKAVATEGVPAPVLTEVATPAAEVQVAPVLSSTSLMVTDAPDQLPRAASGPAVDEGPGPYVYPASSHIPTQVRRDPVIIIRGGMGGVDDKCDLRPRGWRGGIAINRSAPPFRGGIR